ncbi:uncharacterized protein [Miscanthus floridulus]|uniref:uncharacterized protein n=1 Tax=Miscanthus floridulus TaxID=154761 RepID=UPI003458A188
MAIDLNTTPGEEGDQLFDLNTPPDEVDGGTSLGGHHLGLNLEETEKHKELHQGDVNGIDPLPGLIKAASQIDEVHEGDNDIGYHWGLDPDEIDEQELYEGNYISHDDGHPFDLNDPQEEQDNLHAGDDDIALQDAQDAMDDLIHQFGVYTDDVNIIFDEEELTNSDDEEFQETQDQAPNATKNLTDKQRQDIYEDLLQRSNNGKLKRTDTAYVAAKHNVRLCTVQHIWQRAKRCKAQGIPVDVKSPKPKNCRLKKFEVDLSRVADIPLNRRGTIRSLANALGVKKPTLHRWFKEGLLRRHSSALRPYVKEANKKDRLRFCVSMLDPSTMPNNPKFLDMENIIHTDEKWFNGTKKDKTVYMHP